MKENFNVNEEITSSKVKLIDEDGNFIGLFPIKYVLEKAVNSSLDLVEMNLEKDGVSVCKIIDYGKLKYSIIKKKKMIKNSNSNVIKDMKISYNISNNDLDIKNKKIYKFLKKRYKVNYIMELKGREKQIVDDAIEKMNVSLSSFLDIAKWNDLDVSYLNDRIKISTVLSPKT